MTLTAAIAKAYGFDDDLRCRRVERISNDVVEVVTSRRAFWLKLANKTLRSLDELEAEAEVVADLAARGLAVAPPVRRADGHHAGTIELPEGPCSGVLYHEAPGIAVEAPTVMQMALLGALVAKLHLVRLPARCAKIDVETLVRRPLGWIRPWLRQAACDADALDALAGEMSASKVPRRHSSISRSAASGHVRTTWRATGARRSRCGLPTRQRGVTPTGTGLWDWRSIIYAINEATWWGRPD
jgi:hypothetical protein